MPSKYDWLLIPPLKYFDGLYDIRDGKLYSIIHSDVYLSIMSSMSLLYVSVIYRLSVTSMIRLHMFIRSINMEDRIPISTNNRRNAASRNIERLSW